MNVHSLFNTIAEATVYSSVVGIIIFILKSTVLRKLAAKWQYLLWSVMIVKLIFPNGPESKISIFNKINVTEKISETDLTAIAQKPTPIETVMPAETVFNVIPYIWLAGFIIAILWTVTSFALLNYKIHTSSSAASENTLNTLEHCKKITGVHKNIKVVVQNHVSSTALCGITHPRILITEEFEKSYACHIEHTFIHELSHYKRGDIAVNYLLLFLRCVHWFNPVIWFLFSKIRRDTELATDERTMLYLKPDEHKNYGMTLISTISSQSAKSSKLLGMANNKHDIKKRIKAIAKFKKPGFIQHVSGILTVSLIATVCLTSAAAAKPVANKILENLPKAVPVEEPVTIAPAEPVSDIPTEKETDKTEVSQLQLKQTQAVQEYSELQQKDFQQPVAATPEQTNEEIKQEQISRTEYKTENDALKETPSMQNKTNEDVQKSNAEPKNEKDTSTPRNEAFEDKKEADTATEAYGFSELENFENRNIDTLIKQTGQVLDNGNGTTDLTKYAKMVYYNTDYDGAYTFNVKPNEQGYIQFFVENEGYNHSVYIGIYHVDSKGRGWDYCFNTSTKTPIYLDGYDPDEEYVVTLYCYCPGYYDINGRILVY